MASKPNILFILIDDLGWKDLGCFGSDFYETPNLDRLAADGLRFTDAYASCPVCSPTRASILSGKYPARVGVTQFIGGHGVGRLCDVPYFHSLPASERSLATALKQDAGYQTWHVGKWHLGEKQCSPENHGFDVNVAGCGWGMPKQGYFAPFGMPGLEDAPEGAYLTDVLTDRAVDLIAQRDQDRPFFMYLSHYAVHTPIQAPAELIKKYEQKAADLGLDQRNPLVAGDYHPVQHKRSRRIERRQFQSHAAYAAMMENLDTNIGRVLAALDEQGIAEETLVVFTADNGGLSTSEGSPTCILPLAEGKGWMKEGGNRICQIARWPGTIAAGRETAVPVTSTDLYPTMLDLAGIPQNPIQHPDGVSLAGLLRGDAVPEREAIYWHYPHYSNQGDSPAAAVRAGDWKLIEHFEDGYELELYNLKDDIGERHNLAKQEWQKTLQLHAMLRSWQNEVEALFPAPNPNYMGVYEPLPEGCDPAEI